jgi:hypothetical protein
LPSLNIAPDTAYGIAGGFGSLTVPVIEESKPWYEAT